MTPTLEFAKFWVSNGNWYKQKTDMDGKPLGPPVKTGRPVDWFWPTTAEIQAEADKLKEPIKVPKLNKHARRAMTPEEKRAWCPEED